MSETLLDRSYTLRLEPLPDQQDPDGIRRIRALLKCSLRNFRLRCTLLEPANSSSEQRAAEQLLKEWLA